MSKWSSTEGIVKVKLNSGGKKKCYDFVITQVVIRQSFGLTFIFCLRYKVYSGKAKLQF